MSEMPLPGTTSELQLRTHPQNASPSASQQDIKFVLALTSMSEYLRRVAKGCWDSSVNMSMSFLGRAHLLF